MRVNTPRDHGWQNKSGTLGWRDFGREEEEYGRSAITVIENVSRLVATTRVVLAAVLIAVRAALFVGSRGPGFAYGQPPAFDAIGADAPPSDSSAPPSSGSRPGHPSVRSAGESAPGSPSAPSGSDQQYAIPPK
jgi:hypothetical protein